MASLSSFLDQDPNSISSNCFSSSIDLSADLTRSYTAVSRQSCSKTVSNTKPKTNKGFWYWKSTRDRCCFRCGDAGHIVKECRSLIRCFKCGGLGHKKFNCPKLFKGESVLELTLLNCSMLCHNIISLADLYELVYPLRDNGGDYLLLTLAWHFEGLIDGILWRKRREEKYDVFPPLPRPLERKDHVFWFSRNFLKLRRLFADSSARFRRRSLKIMDEILLYFVAISTALSGDSDNVGSTFSDGSDMVGVDQRSMVDPGTEVGKGTERFDEWFLLENDLVGLSASCLDVRLFDSMTMDPCVKECMEDYNIVSYLKMNYSGRNMVCDACSVIAKSTEVNVAVSLVDKDMRLFNSFGVLVDLDEEDEGIAFIDSDERVLNSSVQQGNKTTANSLVGYTDNSDIDSLGTERHIVKDMRPCNSYEVLLDLDKVEECSAMVDVEGYSMVLSKNAGSGSNLLNVIHPDNKNDMLGLKCEEICSSQGILEMSKVAFPVSKCLVVGRKYKRRRTSAVMKFDLWLAMNKGICVNCDQYKSWLVANRQIGDSDLVGLQEDNGERSDDSDSDLSIPLFRRGKRRRVYPRSGLVRRSARIRSYTRF